MASSEELMVTLPQNIQAAFNALDVAVKANPGYNIVGSLTLKMKEVSGERKDLMRSIPFRSDNLSKSDAVYILQEAIKSLTNNDN